jgi:hypothetical protein
MPRPHIEDCIRAVLPPDVCEQVRSHYGRAHLTKKAMAPFWKRFWKDQAFQDRIWRKARELMDIIFDEEDDSWGNWPTQPEECAGIGFLLGIIFEDTLDEMLLELPEDALAGLEEKSRSESASLWEIMFDRLTASKTDGGRSESWKGGEA